MKGVLTEGPRELVRIMESSNYRSSNYGGPTVYFFCSYPRVYHGVITIVALANQIKLRYNQEVRIGKNLRAQRYFSFRVYNIMRTFLLPIIKLLYNAEMKSF